MRTFVGDSIAWEKCSESEIFLGKRQPQSDFTPLPRHSDRPRGAAGSKSLKGNLLLRTREIGS